jgi:glycosyltransferase involved in cell wall biosynthesis
MARALDLVCFSHLRWDFVYQRPQHLLSRWAREHRVIFVEEPIPTEGNARLEISTRQSGVQVVVPHLPDSVGQDADAVQARLIDELFAEHEVREFILWYYTPMALDFTRHLKPIVTVYDCMDELSLFAMAPPTLRAQEAELFQRADLVFTGGQSLYEAKRQQHPSVHLFPSSVDTAHFSRAREALVEPPDQATLSRPRLGYFGVVDERMDLELLAGAAEARPSWQWVIVGPVVKIDPADMPRRENIHYLGLKTYQELPAYLAGWDVALLPFAHNDSTRFISPTKTPEYLAAGKPVVSTSIRDVVHPYGQRGLVHIADTPAAFIAAAEAAMREDTAERLRAVDGFLAEMSWDRTWAEMWALIDAVVGDGEAADHGSAVVGNASRNGASKLTDPKSRNGISTVQRTAGEGA